MRKKTQNFWRNISNNFNINSFNKDLDFENISLGIPNLIHYKTPINYILLTAKCDICPCKCKNEKTNLQPLQKLYRNKIEIERLIAQRKENSKYMMQNGKTVLYSIINFEVVPAVFFVFLCVFYFTFSTKT